MQSGILDKIALIVSFYFKTRVEGYMKNELTWTFSMS